MNGILKQFFKYTSLNILGMLGLSCYILADTYFIADGVGSSGLTALNLAIPLYSFMSGTALMLGIGGAARYAVLNSQKKQRQADRVYTLTLFLSGIFSLIFFIAGCFFSTPLAQLSGADSSVLDLTSTYINVLWMFAPFFICNEVLQCFIRNDNAPHLPMIGMLASNFVNIVLDYIFIFPLNMGIFGAVLATGISPVFSLAIISSHFFRKKNTFHFTKLYFKPGELLKIFSGGLTSFVGEMSTGIVIMVFNFLLLKLAGNIAVAGYGVISNIALVVISIYNGIAQGIQPLCSRFYGTSDKENLHKILKYGLVLAVSVSIIMYSYLYFGADAITSLFNSENNSELQSIAVRGIVLYFTGCLFAGVNIVTATYFVSIEKPLFANIISISRGFAVIIPVTFLLSSLFGIDGLWLSFIAAEGTVMIASSVFLIVALH